MDRPRGESTRAEDSALEPEDDTRGSPGERYRIVLRGHVDRRWSGWFEGFDMLLEEDGTTLLIGPVADQPALHGLLIRIRDLGLAIISICLLDDPAQPSSNAGDAC